MAIKVCKLSEIKDDEGKLFEIKEKKIAIFRKGENAYALDGIFKNLNIAEGKLNKYKTTIPFENIEINIKTGEFVLAPENKIKTYKTEIKDDEIYIEL